MLRRLRAFFLSVLLPLAALAAGAARAEVPPLKLGILPHVSARMLLINYQPLREHLAEALKRPVEIVSAPNFKAYHQRSMAGDFDVFATAANLARIAQKDGGHVPVALFEPPFSGVLVTLKDAKFDGIGALRGKVLALANPQSLIAMKGLRWLDGQGLKAGADFKPVQARNEDSLGHVLVTGEAPFAMMSIGEFRSIGPELRAKLRVFQEFAKVPGFVVLLRRGLPETEGAAIRAALLSFSASSHAAAFKQRTGNERVRAVTEADLAALDDVLAETRALLK
ncbi:MAG: PhnD/SsuA/transferrin family substrate-binding protein [Rhodospirillaceae bacterium]|nr:PhnD/SsuA/transferrin family substrate-binding protein [Rhodospirillaceae bacterium]